jgi:purine-binding chemotaxis protein CheW
VATKTFATFKLDEQLYGIDILFVREINKQIDLTPVPHSPNYIRGLLNLRGQIVTVMDLHERLNSAKSRTSEDSCNVILKTDHELNSIRQREKRTELKSINDTVGLLVDAIDEIVTIDDKDLDPKPKNMSESQAKYVEGVVKLQDQLLAILAVDRLLEVEQ